jgi:hypothetical protein
LGEAPILCREHFRSFFLSEHEKIVYIILYSAKKWIVLGILLCSAPFSGGNWRKTQFRVHRQHAAETSKALVRKAAMPGFQFRDYTALLPDNRD